MKIRPHYSWHQMGPGPKAGSFAAECREAAEMLTCLACVCVTEVQRDGGGEGTSGPQLVCHSLNLLPAAITADRQGHARQLIISLAPDCPDCPLLMQTPCLLRYSSKTKLSACSSHFGLPCQLNINPWQAIKVWTNCAEASCFPQDQPICPSHPCSCPSF